MNLLSFISLLAFFVYIVAGVYVFLDNYKSRLHITFLFMNLSFALYSLAYTFFYLVPTKDFAVFWFRISSVGWTLFPAILLNFALSLTGKYKKLNDTLLQPLIFLPGMVFLIRSLVYRLYVKDFVWNGSFWKFIPDYSSSWLWLFIFYLSSYVLFSFILILRWRNNSSKNKYRTLGSITSGLILFGYLASITSNFVLPAFQILYIPEFSHLACSIVMVGFGFGVIKYKHSVLTPFTAGEAIFSAMQDMVFITNEKLTIIQANKSVRDISGFLTEELLGKPLREFVNWPDKWSVTEKHGFITADETQSNVMLRSKGGERIPVLMTGKAVTDDYNDLMGYLFVAADIRNEIKLKNETEERRELQHELTKARGKAEESDKLKSTFLSNISHELRTPLNGILGFAEILKLELQNSAFSDIADHIDQSGNRLLGTLNSIIDLSLIEANKNEIDKKVVNIPELIRAKASLYKGYAGSKKLYLRIRMPEKNIMSRTDPRLLGHVLSNLLDNAIKYTGEGGLEVSCQRISSGNRYWALIKVQDTGIGIDKEDFSKIFERFRQSSEGHSREYQGMGIGLSICKHFVELLDGEIWIESTKGMGSAFYVKIPSYLTHAEDGAVPKAVVEENTENDGSDSPGQRPCILVVENERSNQEYMKFILTELYDVDTTESGIRALEMVRKNRYDVIYMDVNLNRDMTGIETMKKIRGISNYGDCAIAVVTANVMKNSREELIQSGFTHSLIKPFTRKQLLELTRQMLH